MLESKPVTILDAPLDDFGNREAFASLTDPTYNAEVMITGNVSFQPKYLLSAGATQKTMLLDGVPLIAVGSPLFAVAPQQNRSLNYPGQDSVTLTPFSSWSVIDHDLSAPPLYTGNNNLQGRC